MEEKNEVKIEENNEVKIENKKTKKNNKKTKIIVASLIILIICLVVAILFVLFNNNDKNKTTKTEVTTEVKESAYRISGNSLGDFDLHFLQLENEKVNKIYSPLSIKYALKMLGEGSKGNSKAQIDSVIGDYKAKKYTNSQNMSFANAMFIKNSYKDAVKLSYTDKLLNKYNAEIVYDSFENANNLNSWVSNKTFNLINNLFDDESVKSQDFALVNALAIDMEWNKKIQATWANYKDMYSVSYEHENFSSFVPIIEGDDSYSSVKFDNNTQNVQAVEIGAAINNYDIVKELGEENIRKTVGDAYKKWLNEPDTCNNDALDVNAYLDTYIKEINSNYKRVDTSTDFSLYVDENVKVFAKDLKEYDGTTLQYIGIMPKNVSLDSYIKELDSKKVNTIISSLKEIKAENFKSGVVTKITGYIPLFKFDYELKLIEDLKQLGIKDVFDSKKADLSGMISGKGSIDSASHKANIEFSNEGIKAAAATQMGGLGAASCGFEYNYDVPVETIDLTFNNPYLFLIRDKNSGEVWFTGTVYNPVSK